MDGWLLFEATDCVGHRIDVVLRRCGVSGRQVGYGGCWVHAECWVVYGDAHLSIRLGWTGHVQSWFSDLS